VRSLITGCDWLFVVYTNRTDATTDAIRPGCHPAAVGRGRIVRARHFAADAAVIFVGDDGSAAGRQRHGIVAV
jgi:hypothetical protein